MNEHTWLNWLAQQYPHLTDDVHMPDAQQMVTMDVLVENHHFSWQYFTPQQLGWKAVAVNASDIAATGGLLDGIVVGLTLPANTPSQTVQQVYEGMQHCLNQLPQAPTLWGGDTTAGPCWMISLTAMGHLPAGYTAGRRWQAQPGDWVLTTGPHGLSAIGLRAWQQGTVQYPQARQHHVQPMPRCAQGQQLAAVGCRYALMDSSDGLADAALKLAQASRVNIALWANALPPHPELALYAQHQALDPLALLNLQLYGGEDFELVACWPADQPVPQGFTVIGRVESHTPVQGPGSAWITHDTGVLPLTFGQTYQHFSPPAQRGKGPY
jgi:thiamine-monophosphate kinase